MLNEPKQLRSERTLREGDRTITVDPRGDLHDVVVGEAKERPSIADVDDLYIAAVRRQGCDELEGGLAVERPTSLLEQRWFLLQVRIAVHLEQLALDLGNGSRAGLGHPLFLKDLPLGV